MKLAEPAAPCGRCGHPRWKHLSLVAFNATKVYDPTTCWAEGGCGCTALLDAVSARRRQEQEPADQQEPHGRHTDDPTQGGPA